MSIDLPEPGPERGMRGVEGLLLDFVEDSLRRDDGLTIVDFFVSSIGTSMFIA